MRTAKNQTAETRCNSEPDLHAVDPSLDALREVHLFSV